MRDTLHHIHEKIALAAQKRGKGALPCLIAAAKQQSPDHVAELIGLGVMDIGENRVQEAQAMRQAMEARGLFPRWHFIGPLQSNKASEAAALFDVVHSLDRIKIARMLSESCQKLGKVMECFVQVNIGREPQKHGADIEGLPDFIAQVRELGGLKLVGLMAVPPEHQPPAPYFALLAELATRAGLSGLSMGMSNDYETAIRLGATHIRLGTALFGPRS